MFDQLFESFRKASESSLHAQQEMFRQWMQQWPSTPMTAAGMTSEWADVQKRWMESAAEALHKHRAFLDSAYKSNIEMIEQAFRFSEARSAEDYRRVAEELWHKMSDTFKAQSESQLREIQTATQKWTEKAHRASAAS